MRGSLHVNRAGFPLFFLTQEVIGKKISRKVILHNTTKIKLKENQNGRSNRRCV